MRGSRGDRVSERPHPPRLKNHKKYRRFACGPLMAPLIMVFGSYRPNQLKKNNKQNKILVKVGPPLAKLSESAQTLKSQGSYCFQLVTYKHYIKNFKNISQKLDTQLGPSKLVLKMVMVCG